MQVTMLHTCKIFLVTNPHKIICNMCAKYKTCCNGKSISLQLLSLTNSDHIRSDSSCAMLTLYHTLTQSLKHKLKTAWSNSFFFYMYRNKSFSAPNFVFYTDETHWFHSHILPDSLEHISLAIWKGFDFSIWFTN